MVTTVRNLTSSSATSEYFLQEGGYYLRKGDDETDLGAKQEEHRNGSAWHGLLDRSPGAQLFAVGDDWQAIYRFGGSDIAVMREFGDRFGDFERIDLETTFRCSDRIAGVATDFVLRNPAQIRKTVRATRKGDGPAVHVGLAGDGGLSLLKEALDRIAEDAGRHDGTSEVLLLGRYRHSQPLKSSRSGRPNEMLALSAAGFHPEMKVGIMAWYRPGATPRK